MTINKVKILYLSSLARNELINSPSSNQNSDRNVDTSTSSSNDIIFDIAVFDIIQLMSDYLLTFNRLVYSQTRSRLKPIMESKI